MLRISGQFLVVENDLNIREIEIAELRLDIKKDLLEIFKIGNGTESLQDEFDMEGDDDILKMNFGGRNIDIKRSVLTKPKFGWNLFISKKMGWIPCERPERKNVCGHERRVDPTIN
jgi:hypothetical protein